MDFSFVALFVLATVGAAVLTIRAASDQGPKSSPRGMAFVAIFIVGLIMLRPWATFKSSEWQELAAVTLIMAVWVAFGSVAGGALGRRFTKSPK